MTMIEHYRPVADDRIEFHNANVANSRLSYAGDPSVILALKCCKTNRRTAEVKFT